MNRTLLLLLCAALLVGAVGACQGDEFDEDQVLGGQTVSANALNLGLKVYRQNCSGCHGKDGKGAALHAPGKQPRDLTHGYYKYTSVAGDGLPTDEDLVRILKTGLAGGRMPAYDLPKDQLLAVSHYVKTLAPRWRSETAGTSVTVHADPWEGQRTAAIQRGYEVYHGVAQCWNCHAAYAPQAEVLSMLQAHDRSQGLPARKTAPFRSEMARSASVDTRYGKVLPPDFLSDRVPAAKGVGGVYRAIAAGIGGTEMPTWSERLTASDLWAVVHYVRELIRRRKTPGAARMRNGLPEELRIKQQQVWSEGAPHSDETVRRR